jgi:hypothetical protein
MTAYHGTSHPRLDVLPCLINECADSNGQRHAARNQVHAPSDTGHDRLPVRRLEGHMARRLEQMQVALFGYGRTGKSRTGGGARYSTQQKG